MFLSWNTVKSLPSEFIFRLRFYQPNQSSDQDCRYLFAVRCACRGSSPSCTPTTGRYWKRKGRAEGWSKSRRWSQWQEQRHPRYPSNLRMKHFFWRAFRRRLRRNLGQTPRFHASYFRWGATGHFHMKHRITLPLSNKSAVRTWSSEIPGSPWWFGIRLASKLRTSNIRCLLYSDIPLILRRSSGFVASTYRGNRSRKSYHYCRSRHFWAPCLATTRKSLKRPYPRNRHRVRQAE